MTAPELRRQINEVQLVDVQLYSVAFRNHKVSVDWEEAVVPDWKLSYSVQFRQPAPAELHIKLRAEMEYGEEESRPRPFDLAVELVGIYASSDPIEAERIPELLRSHSAPLLWPYLREIVWDLTTRAGGPTFVAPTLKYDVPAARPARRRSRGGGESSTQGEG
jgi:preprotein translocase subunit SecB